MASKPDNATVELWLEIIRPSLIFYYYFFKVRFDVVFFGIGNRAFITVLTKDGLYQWNPRSQHRSEFVVWKIFERSDI